MSLGGRTWEVPGTVIQVGGVTMDEARLRIARSLHARAGVPPWRDLVHQSAELVRVSVAEEVRR